VVGRVPRNVLGPISKLPGNKDAAFAANLHSCKALVEAWDEAAHTLREYERLRIAEFRLSIGPHHRLAVFHHGRPAVAVRIELFAGRCKVPGVVHVVHHVGRSVCTGADLDLFVAQGKIGLDDTVNPGNSSGQLEPPIRGSCGGGLGRGGGGFFGCGRRGGRRRLGGSLGARGGSHRRHAQDQGIVFHDFVVLQRLIRISKTSVVRRQ